MKGPDMSFIIKSFNITPQALEIKDAVPDNSEFCLTTDVVCLSHFTNDKISFTYKAGSRTIAFSEKCCEDLRKEHEVCDEVKVISRGWGNGVEALINISVTVAQEKIGSRSTYKTITWVKR